jgi:mannosyl-oligosaccharide alpha-1,2-mannosidase
MLDPEDSAKLVPPQKWVFNTEAHPLPVFKWSEEEVNEFGINTT